MPFYTLFPRQECLCHSPESSDFENKGLLIHSYLYAENR